MMIRLRRADNALWTEEFLQMLEHDGPEPLGLDITPQGLRSIANSIRRMINNGRPEPRQAGKKLWEILFDDEVAGDISLNEEGEFPELTLCVLLRFRGLGVAREALSLFLREYQVRPLDAVVRTMNPNRECMRSLLTRFGFRLVQEPLLTSVYRLEGTV